MKVLANVDTSDVLKAAVAGINEVDFTGMSGLEVAKLRLHLQNVRTVAFLLDPTECNITYEDEPTVRDRVMFFFRWLRGVKYRALSLVR